MSKIYFSLGIHNHQPVGNFDHVFKQAYDRAYRPFLDIALEHPQIKFSLHTSGCLFEWLEHHETGYFDRVGKLVERGQIELLGGAFYEPILTILPRDDAHEQIARTQDYIHRRFGIRPRGAWLAERVWDPHLAAILSEAGVEYVPLDDDQFLSAGHSFSEMNGYFLTESNSGPLALFPIHKRLRYTIPFEQPQVTLDYMRRHAGERSSPLFVMADDGEKFGMWPHTYDSVYDKGWLHDFFRTLERHADEIEMLTLGEARDRIPPVGRTYLPTGSYAEMGEWVLPPKAGRRFETLVTELSARDDWPEIRPFVRGGFWRGFLAKYPEVNHLHKKMLRTSRKYHRLSSRKRDRELYTPLLRAQCNCPYWHGIFGGLYLPHLRHAVWKELLLAEQAIDNVAHRGGKWVDIGRHDFDADGFTEILVENSQINAYLSPRQGGLLSEWDFRPRGYNLLNTLTRREESYHSRLRKAVLAGTERDEESAVSIHDRVLSKEPDLDKALHYDRWPRLALLDHFHGWNARLDEFRDSTLIDYGNFLAEPYEIAEMFTDGVTLHRLGAVGGTSVEVSKTVRAVPGKPVLTIQYRIRNLASHDLHSPFGIEWNLALQAPNSDRHYITLPDTGEERRPLNETREHRSVREVFLADENEHVAARFKFESSMKLWRVPIESVSLSEAGFEKVFQSIALLFQWELHLRPGQDWRRQFTAVLSEA